MAGGIDRTMMTGGRRFFKGVAGWKVENARGGAAATARPAICRLAKVRGL